MRKRTLVADVVHELQQMIIKKEVKPGEFLPPRKELAVRFGVGLSTIQEATQALTAMGMLESRPGKGTWVRQDALETLIPASAVGARLGELDARKLYDARSVIEVGLTEFAAQRASPRDVEDIWSALERMKIALDDDEAFVEADLAFHLAVAKAGHNELLEQLYHLSHKLLADVITEIVKLPNVKEDAIRIQEEIAAAIEQHDRTAARQAALRHMEIIEQLIDTWSGRSE
jgi:GntR family transcriptional repressor for pyruvate dehydrogenase complex